MNPISPLIHLVDDDASVREALALLIGTVGLRVAPWADPQDFLARFDRDAVGAIVLDMRMPGLSGVEVLRRVRERYEEALALHRKGLGASPFAEHKDGAMKCLEQLERYPEFVEAAEQLWHFAQDHGYGRHDPSNYFGSVGWALRHLNRSAEIEIWLDRLRQTRQHLDDDDPELPNLLGSEAVLLGYLHPHKPKDCDARLDAIAPLLLRVGNTWGLMRLGMAYLTAGQPQKAVEACERSVARHRPEADSQERLNDAHEELAKAKQALKQQQPFWRRWL